MGFDHNRAFLPLSESTVWRTKATHPRKLGPRGAWSHKSGWDGAGRGRFCQRGWWHLALSVQGCVQPSQQSPSLGAMGVEKDPAPLPPTLGAEPEAEHGWHEAQVASGPGAGREGRRRVPAGLGVHCWGNSSCPPPPLSSGAEAWHCLAAVLTLGHAVLPQF